MKSANKYNRQSRVMKRAWASFKSCLYLDTPLTFSECLRESWEIENEKTTDNCSDFTNKSVNDIFDILLNRYETSMRGHKQLTDDAQHICDIIIKNSNNYRVDIAKRMSDLHYMSGSQVWSLSFEFIRIRDEKRNESILSDC